MVTFSAELGNVRLEVRDTDGHLVASVLRAFDEAFALHAQLANALIAARDHREGQAA